jgi:hypothetical protein
MMPVLAAS